MPYVQEPLFATTSRTARLGSPRRTGATDSPSQEKPFPSLPTHDRTCETHPVFGNPVFGLFVVLHSCVSCDHPRSARSACLAR